MNTFDSIFDGLLGYEKLMLLCGLILFVFALAAITLLIVQRRDFKAAILLIGVAILLMGFPGIQVVKFSQDMVELDRIRAQPTTPTDPAQQQQSAQTLGALEARAADNPKLQAQVADGYRAIGELDKAYQLAQLVLQQKPSAQVQATLVPVLTAKLNQVQAGVPIALPPAAPVASSPAPGAAPTPAPAAPAAGSPPTSEPAGSEPHPATATVADPARQREIATIAGQLHDTAAPLPAATHAALAKAYVVLGQPRQAQANVDAALRLNPNIKINARVLQAARANHVARPPER